MCGLRFLQSQKEKVKNKNWGDNFWLLYFDFWIICCSTRVRRNGSI